MEPIFCRRLACLILCFALATSAGAASEGLQKLEALTKQAPTLDQFLARPALVNLYLQTAQEYYGEERFTSKGYYAILQQLGTIKDKVPGLAARLWETTDLGMGFTLQTPGKTQGVELKRGPWREHLIKWSRDLGEKAKGIYSVAGEERVLRLKKDLSVILDHLQIFREDDLAGVSGDSKRKKALETFLDERLPTLHEFQELSAYVAREIIFGEGILEILYGADADLVIEVFESLKLPENLTHSVLKDLPPALKVALIEPHLPTLEIPALELVKGHPAETEFFVARATKNEETGTYVFDDKKKTVAFQFEPLPRRFHGIFKSLVSNECLGGGCGESLLTTRRWGTVALKRTQFFHVEANGHYLGYLQLVPGTASANGRTAVFASVDFGAPILRMKTTAIDPETEDKKQVTLFEHWLKASRKNWPADWWGLIVSESANINSRTVLNTVRRSAQFRFGDLVNSRFSPEDPLADRIAEASNRAQQPTGYGARMILDGTVADAGRLRRLAPELDYYFFKDRKKVLGLFQAKEPRSRIAAIQAVQDAGVKNRDVLLELVASLHDNDSSVRRAAVEALGVIHPEDSKVNHEVAHLLGDSNVEIRKVAAEALRVLDAENTSVHRKLSEALKDSDAEVRLAAATALWASHPQDDEVLRRLGDALLDPDMRVATQALITLKEANPSDKEVHRRMLTLLLTPRKPLNERLVRFFERYKKVNDRDFYLRICRYLVTEKLDNLVYVRQTLKGLDPGNSEAAAARKATALVDPENNSSFGFGGESEMDLSFREASKHSGFASTYWDTVSLGLLSPDWKVYTHVSRMLARWYELKLPFPDSAMPIVLRASLRQKRETAAGGVDHVDDLMSKRFAYEKVSNEVLMQVIESMEQLNEVDRAAMMDLIFHASMRQKFTDKHLLMLAKVLKDKGMNATAAQRYLSTIETLGQKQTIPQPLVQQLEELLRTSKEITADLLTAIGTVAQKQALSDATLLRVADLTRSEFIGHFARKTMDRLVATKELQKQWAMMFEKKAVPVPEEKITTKDIEKALPQLLN